MDLFDPGFPSLFLTYVGLGYVAAQLTNPSRIRCEALLLERSATGNAWTDGQQAALDLSLRDYRTAHGILLIVNGLIVTALGYAVLFLLLHAPPSPVGAGEPHGPGVLLRGAAEDPGLSRQAVQLAWCSILWFAGLAMEATFGLGWWIEERDLARIARPSPTAGGGGRASSSVVHRG